MPPHPPVAGMISYSYISATIELQYVLMGDELTVRWGARNAVVQDVINDIIGIQKETMQTTRFNWHTGSWLSQDGERKYDNFRLTELLLQLLAA